MLNHILRLGSRVRLCRPTTGLPPGTIVLFPISRTRLNCGLAGIVELVRAGEIATPDLEAGESAVSAV